ncbi:hypothetical protein [Pseudomonas sp. H1h]|uniref:hypothetical protein n=1 Tax=Pseudomonas sp. H1h TaxID=1397280 RepID=UPI000468DEE1|nr:hypothetical protein [Pseudomonas sp. H1h]
MKCVILLGLTVLLTSCQVRQEQSPAPMSAPLSVIRGVSTADQRGLNTLAAIKARYNDVRLNCGSASMPAFLCSGLVMRATVPSNDYSTWNPSPHSQQSGGVSFSYLRKDAKFQGLAFGQISGFIFYPVLATPPGKRRIEILCAFPIDGWTQLRDKPGCGAHPYYPTQSLRCQTIGITTAEQWMQHWYAGGAAPARQCSFDVRDNMNHLAADSFYQSIRARAMLGNAWFVQYNELILATWPQSIPKELPIEAFFYLYSPGGVAAAQHDQRDFYQKSGGQIVPIIQMVLPATPTQDALFAFYPADQLYH